MAPKNKSAEGEVPPTAAVLIDQVDFLDYHKGTKKSSIEKKLWRCIGHDLIALRCFLGAAQ